MSEKIYDVVIIGGGHNGLTCACYLAAAGKSVKVLERRSVVGGAAVTEEFHPGFRNSVAAYTVSLLNPKVIDDLELYDNGLTVVEREIANFWPLGGTRYLKLPFGLENVQREFARISPTDAANLEDFYNTLEIAAEVLRGLILETPPNVGGGILDLWRAAKLGKTMLKLSLEEQRLLLDIFTVSAVEFLSRWFKHPEVLGAFCFDGVVGFYGSPHTPGTAYVLLHHAFGEVNGKKGMWGHAIGGMGAITQAMARVAEKRGTSISVDASVAEVLTENDKACGVRLENGEVIRAKVVASNIHPQLLFQKLVDPGLLEPNFRRRIDQYKSGSGTFRMNVALSELPDFTCLPGTEPAEHHKCGIVIGPTVEYLDQAYDDAKKYGWSKAPIIEMLIPSTLDDTLAPPGQHVASLFCQQFAPELPNGDSWDDHKETAADLIIETVNKYAPNFKASILARSVMSPLDLERDFGLVGGDIVHGTLKLNQMFSARPVMGYGDYRTPIKGLYMCGSGTHPGGGVTGAPGHNAAREILRDLR